MDELGWKMNMHEWNALMKNELNDETLKGGHLRMKLIHKYN